MTERAWRTSTFSGSQANCVEVAAADRVLVRDTKDKSGAVLRFTPAAWRRFAAQLKRSLADLSVRAGRARSSPRSPAAAGA